MLGNARAFRRVVDELVEPWTVAKVNRVAGIEARGFILGGAVAHQVSAGEPGVGHQALERLLRELVSLREIHRPSSRRSGVHPVGMVIA